MKNIVFSASQFVKSVYLGQKFIMVATQFSPALEDLAEFLAKVAPRKVLDFKASPRSQERLDFLLSKNKQEQLSQEEQQEMTHFMLVEHLFIMAKARAIQRLNLVLQ